MPGIVYRGKTGKGYVNGTEISIVNLNFTPKTELLDCTSTKSGGHRERCAGLDDFEVSFDFIAKDDELPALLGITRGTVVYVKQQVDTNKFNAGNVIIESIGMPIDIGEVNKVSVSGQAANGTSAVFL